jgi:hypothetical protein
MNAIQAWLEERSNPLLTKKGEESPFFSFLFFLFFDALILN